MNISDEDPESVSVVGKNGRVYQKHKYQQASLYLTREQIAWCDHALNPASLGRQRAPYIRQLLEADMAANPEGPPTVDSLGIPSHEHAINNDYVQMPTMLTPAQVKYLKQVKRDGQTKMHGRDYRKRQGSVYVRWLIDQDRQRRGGD